MRVIVVSGARSNVGKTHLARALSELLPGAVRVKIGHHERKPDKDDILYPMGTPFSTIAADHGGATILIVESNHILEEITPTLTIYLPADNPKPSARLAEEKAEIIRGKPVSSPTISLLAKRLGRDEATVRRIAELSGAILD